MSDPVDPPLMPPSPRRAATDRRILAYVEKWMVMIREISREQQEQAKQRP